MNLAGTEGKFSGSPEISEYIVPNVHYEIIIVCNAAKRRDQRSTG